MTDTRKENSYRSILRGTSAFGGVQLFQILVNLLRGKFVAIFLGPAGMGISALLASATATIQQFSSLGLNLAIVREVATNKDDPHALSTAMSVGRRLIYATAIVGALVCLLFAAPLSRLTFGSDEYTLWFAALSLMLFFGIAGAGQLSMLQGLHAVRRLSLSSLVGALAGLCIGVPLYWLLGVKGIVPAMIVLALTTYIFYTISLRQTVGQALPRTRFAWRSHSPLVKRLIALGLVLMASNLIGSLASYIVVTYVRHASDVTTVGLYQGANSLTNQYIGMVFSAMALDFFPRLSAAAADNSKVRTIVNRQTEIVALICTPLVIALILSAPLVIRLLLDSRFLDSVPLMRWMGFGILFRALMFPLGYISFAKDDKRLYFCLEGLLGNTLSLIFSITLFHFFGLIGLGIAIAVDASVSLAIYYFVNSRRYGFRYSRRSLRLMLYALILGGAVFGFSFIGNAAVAYTLMSLTLAVSAAYGFVALRRLLREER